MVVGREKFGPQAVKDAGPANTETASLSFSLTVDDLADSPVLLEIPPCSRRR